MKTWLKNKLTKWLGIDKLKGQLLIAEAKLEGYQHKLYGYSDLYKHTQYMSNFTKTETSSITVGSTDLDKNIVTFGENKFIPISIKEIHQNCMNMMRKYERDLNDYLDYEANLNDFEVTEEDYDDL
jgi:hypothetical protein